MGERTFMPVGKPELEVDANSKDALGETGLINGGVDEETHCSGELLVWPEQY